LSVRDLAARYFSYVDGHDAVGLSQLFAEDGWLRPPPPVREELQGREAIRTFYEQLFVRSPDIAIEPDFRLIVDGYRCAAQFVSTAAGKRRDGVLDVFTANDRDELVEMVAYSRMRYDNA
jgi:hypothetical protein